MRRHLLSLLLLLLLLIVSPEVFWHVLYDVHDFLFALAALVCFTLLFNKSQFPVIKISLLFNRLDVIQKQFVVPQLLRQMLL